MPFSVESASLLSLVAIGLQRRQFEPYMNEN
jgi:hypothetical protein